MPKKLHDALARSARKHGFKGKRYDRYVYGGMAKIESRKRKKHGKTVAHG